MIHDPIGAFDSIKEHFLRYVKTSFGIRSQLESNERDGLLERGGIFYRQPWIEPLPEYESSNKKIAEITLADLPGMNDEGLKAFKGLVGKGLFSGNYPMHAHQWEMLQEAAGGNHCVITSGTGSGKTESFLLPLFAQLAKEMAQWEQPENRNRAEWWNNGVTAANAIGDDFLLNEQYRQRGGEKRPAAMRALILYPMNALVEDQMSRLRRALDSNEVRAWLNEHHKGNRLYFGRYNSNTPVPGSFRKPDGTRDDARFDRLKQELRSMSGASAAVEQYIHDQGGIDVGKAAELRSFFPRLDGAEMYTRADMQMSPPDILITNFSMLSIMMMREVDQGIIEKTRAWLAGEDLPEDKREAARKDRIFHLVVDELHLYRGSAGSEVAYLIRLLLYRLGLDPSHSQLRILASSASLNPNDQQSKEFIQDFFGVAPAVFMDGAARRFRIITGTERVVAPGNAQGQPLPIQYFRNLAQTWDQGNGDPQHQPLSANIVALAHALGLPADQPDDLTAAFDHLAKDAGLRERLCDACTWPNGDRRACRSLRGNGDAPDDAVQGPVFAEKLFGNDVQQDAREALRGLLILRSMFDHHNIKHELPRFRFHYFFRNIEGLWASVDPQDSDTPEADRLVGRLYGSPRIISGYTKSLVGKVELSEVEQGIDPEAFEALEAPCLGEDGLYASIGSFMCRTGGCRDDRIEDALEVPLEGMDHLGHCAYVCV